MSNVFVDTTTVVQQMCDDYKSITGITLSPQMIDDSNVIKFYAYAGAISSLYSECQRTVNDIFPATASEEALIQHLATRSLPARIQPQKSHGQIQFTLTGAATIPVGAQVSRVSDGSVYQTIQTVTSPSAGAVNLFVESLNQGNSQNLDTLNNPFTLVTPVTNVTNACINTGLFLDGRDLETSQEMVARIQAHDQDNNSGGNAVAYENWAHLASNEVVTAKCVRLLRGPDTVDVIITSGTTDISAAVKSGQAVTRLPSAPLIAQVQAYINTLNPVTDDLLVRGPSEAPFTLTFKYNLYNETAANRSYVDSQILQVIQIFIYSAQPLDVINPTELERLVDQAIGDQIKERICLNFTSTTSYFTVPQDQVLVPTNIVLGPLV